MSQSNHLSDVDNEGSSAFKKAANEAGKVVIQKASKAVSSKFAGYLLRNPVVIGIAITVFLVLLGGMVAAFIVLSSAGEQQAKTGEGYYGGEISDFGLNEIPAQYIPIYKAAQEKYGVPWNLLAAEHRVETVFPRCTIWFPRLGPLGLFSSCL
jgi:hypothetical protein